MRWLIPLVLALSVVVADVAAQAPPPISCEDELSAAAFLIRYLQSNVHPLAREVAARDKEIARLRQREAQLAAELKKHVSPTAAPSAPAPPPAEAGAQ